MQKAYEYFNRESKKILIALIVVFAVLLILPFILNKRVSIDKEYWDKESVALYIKKYNTLPKNYITHYGLEYAKRHNLDLTSKIVGGDTHWNDGSLADFGIEGDVVLKECDIWSNQYDITSDNINRGELRLVYEANRHDGRVFYTSNHYGSFKEITSFSLQLPRNICWIIFTIYSAGALVYLILMFTYDEDNPEAIR